MRTPNTSRERGFSLLEVTLSILVLLVIMAAVFKQVDNVTRVAKRESMTTDLVQQNRDFVDLFVRDIHMTGYPLPTMYAIAPSTGCAPEPQCEKSVAVGIVSASPTSLRLEGDIYGDGNVYSVLYTYYQVDPNNPPDPNCPCLRRSAVLKIAGDPLTGQSAPQYYTEVQNIIDPTGMTQGIFTFFDAGGNPVNVGAGIDFENNGLTLQTIDAVKVNLNVRSTQTDPQTGQKVVNSLASIAELEN